jgi:hypothetical protein
MGHMCGRGRVFARIVGGGSGWVGWIGEMSTVMIRR